MAALSAYPLSQAIGNIQERDLEQQQEQQDVNIDVDKVDNNNLPPASTTTTDPNAPQTPHTTSHQRHLATQRYTRAYFSPIILLVLIMTAAVPTIYIYLYVGALWDPQEHIGHVSVKLINLDTGINYADVAAANGLNATGSTILQQIVPYPNLGLYLSNTFIYSSQTANLFKWSYYDSTNSSYMTLEAAQEAVASGRESSWYILMILPNYTATYLAQGINVYSLNQLNDDLTLLVENAALPSPFSGNYSNYIYQVWDQGRNFATYSILQSVVTAVLAEVNTGITTKILSIIAALPYGLSYVKTSFLLQPLPVSSQNMHPVLQSACTHNHTHHITHQ